MQAYETSERSKLNYVILLCLHEKCDKMYNMIELLNNYPCWC